MVGRGSRAWEAGARARAAGYGEAAPVPGFSRESVDEIEAVCREIGEWVEEERLWEAVRDVPCLANALGAAFAELDSDREGAERRAEAAPYLGVAALLPAGRAALQQIEPKAEMGFRVFKWKVGVGDMADELALLDDVCARLPNGGKLRLDANGAWDRRQAERWLERCAERPVEFVEQPAFAEPTEGAARRAKVDDLLLGLAGDFPTTIALDESVVGDGDVERWLGAGWPGVFVVKPSLLADMAGAMEALERAKADVVFSSALETAVGARNALRVAFEFERGRTRVDPERKATARALGFGVYPLFKDARFDGPAAGPFVRWEDVARIDVESVWASLGGAESGELRVER